MKSTRFPRWTVRTSFFVVQCHESSNFKLFLNVPKKHIPRAVDRNLIKRRMRSVFQKNLAYNPPLLELHINPLPSLSSSTLFSAYNDVKEAVEQRYSALHEKKSPRYNINS